MDMIVIADRSACTSDCSDRFSDKIASVADDCSAKSSFNNTVLGISFMGTLYHNFYCANGVVENEKYER